MSAKLKLEPLELRPTVAFQSPQEQLDAAVQFLWMRRVNNPLRRAEMQAHRGEWKRRKHLRVVR